MANKNKKDNEAVPKEAVATPEQVQKLLNISDEKAKEIQAEQAKLLKLHRSRAILSPLERQKARGVELEQHYLKTGNMDGVAEALSLQGRFADAAKVAESVERRELYQEKDDAAKGTDKDCECDNFTPKGGLMIPTQYVEFYAYSEKHKCEMPFIRCTNCGNLNAKPLPEYLAEINQAQLRSAAMGVDTPANQVFKAAI